MPKVHCKRCEKTRYHKEILDGEGPKIFVCNTCSKVRTDEETETELTLLIEKVASGEIEV